MGTEALPTVPNVRLLHTLWDLLIANRCCDLSVSPKSIQLGGKESISKQSGKRKYRNSLEVVESGFRACWRNAQDLVTASQKLIENGLHAPALSLSVLALEELAKLYAVDGLLYARHDDHKADDFFKASRNLRVKLTFLNLFPRLLGNLSRADPRYGTEPRYKPALAVSIQQMKQDGNAVMDKLRDNSFDGLDYWKQQGFYVSTGDRGFVPPRDAIDPALAKAVLQLAWRATTTLDFVLNGALERYIENAQSIRTALTEKQHQELERLGKELFA